MEGLLSTGLACIVLKVGYQPVAIPEGGAERLEPGDMSRQLEDAENPEDAEDLGCLGNVLEGVLVGEGAEEEGQEEGQDAHQVDHVHEGYQK